MPTVNSIRDKVVDKYSEHIIAVDHNVVDEYDSEYSIHLVCHPEIDSNNCQSVPNDIVEYLNEISEDMKITTGGMQVHIHSEISKETLGIDDGVTQESNSDTPKPESTRND